MTLADWLADEPFSLALSSSFFGFFAHCGAFAALEERGLLPSRVTGSSAGALVAGAVASGLSATEMRSLFVSIRREDFWDPELGPGLLAGRKFRDLLKRHLAPTFDLLKIPLEVAAVDAFRFRTRFLNEGSVPEAVYASCAVPLMFHPIRIDGRIWIDGGVICKSGYNQERRDERSLCVFIPAEGLTGAYERRFNAETFGSRTALLSLPGLPRVSPARLETGPIAFQAAYRKVQGLLDQPAHAQLNQMIG